MEWEFWKIPPAQPAGRAPRLTNPSIVKNRAFGGSENDFAKEKSRETRVQRREFSPLFAFTFTLPCHAGVAQRAGEMSTPIF
jgi:hypothetical protein